MTTQDRTPAEVLALLAQSGLRPFTKEDWMAWAGCESENPFYGEVNHSLDNHTILILDGDMVWVQDISSDMADGPDEGRTYVLNKR